MLNERLMLAKMRGVAHGLDDDDKSFDSDDMKETSPHYWTLMDVDGNIQELPQGMKELLDKQDWTTIQAKQVKLEDFSDNPDSTRWRGQTGSLIVLNYQ